MPQHIEVNGQVIEFPDGMAASDIESAIKKNMLSIPAKSSVTDDIKQGIGNLAAGAIRGAGSIGSSILYPIDKITDMVKGDRNMGLSSLVTGVKPLSRNEERRQQIDEGLRSMGAEPESMLYKGGKLAGEIAGTAGAGGALVGGFKSIPTIAQYAPSVANVLQKVGGLESTALSTKAPALLDAIRTGGFSVNGITGTAGLATRASGGAISGGLSSGLVNPNDAATGALIGGALPTALMGLGKLGGSIYNGGKALVQPFTDSGQNAIRDSILRSRAAGGNTALDLAQLIPGTRPTLAEASGNANLATMQRVLRDANPEPFIQAEKQNASARNALLDSVSGDSDKLAYFKADRENTANALYGAAMKEGISPKSYTKPIQSAISDLMDKPAIQSAAMEAKRLAKNEGINITDAGSLEGLHYMKMALDQQIGKASSLPGAENDARILLGVKDQLSGVMNKLSPKYAEANATFSEMSKPINQMEFLQGLNLTDKMGNMTLAKVQNAIRGIERNVDASGINGAKSLSNEQVGALTSIRDDLLRSESRNLGRSEGSNTLQNIVTNNFLQQALPGKLGEIAVKNAGTGLGQVGQLLYSKPNEAIRAKLLESFLNPSIAQEAFAPKLLQAPAAKGLLGNSLDDILQTGYKVAPGLLSRF